MRSQKLEEEEVAVGLDDEEGRGLSLVNFRDARRVVKKFSLSHRSASRCDNDSSVPRAGIGFFPTRHLTMTLEETVPRAQRQRPVSLVRGPQPAGVGS